MTIKVNAEGALIPKELLGGVDEIEVSPRPGNQLVIQLGPRPGQENGTGESRSTFERLGSDPIDDGPTDASARHGHYIYGDPHGERAG